MKLADFGIAKRHDGDDVTVIGEIVGTPKYLAPELLDGAPATPSSDVYGTGVVLFEMLAGHPPFDANTPLATRSRIGTIRCPTCRFFDPTHRPT